MTLKRVEMLLASAFILKINAGAITLLSLLPSSLSLMMKKKRKKKTIE